MPHVMPHMASSRKQEQGKENKLDQPGAYHRNLSDSCSIRYLLVGITLPAVLSLSITC